MFSILENIHELVKEQTRLTRHLIAKSSQAGEQYQPLELPEGITFPIRSAEEMDRLETSLRNAQNTSSVVSFQIIFDIRYVK